MNSSVPATAGRQAPNVVAVPDPARPTHVHRPRALYMIRWHSDHKIAVDASAGRGLKATDLAAHRAAELHGHASSVSRRHVEQC